jgi:hypothetical protein
MISTASPLIFEYLNFQPRERRQRLDGLQQIVDEVIPLFEVALFQACVDWVSTQAEEAAGTCRRCRARTRRETKPVKVKLKRFSTLWDTFWHWHDKRDTRRFHGRLRGQGLNKFEVLVKTVNAAA